MERVTGVVVVPILGTPTSVVVLIAVAVVLSFALPIIYGLKFDWDPENITVAMEEENR